jgi:integrase
MPPANASALVSEVALLDAYRAYLKASGRGTWSMKGARAFFARWPDPQNWAREPLEVRLAVKKPVRSLLNFLMFHGHLRPGYDYLFERTLAAIWREMPTGPWGAELKRFQVAAEALGYGPRTRSGAASQVAARLLIQTGRVLLTELTEQDFEDFEAAVAAREVRRGRSYSHYRDVLHATRTVVYHLGNAVEPKPKASAMPRWSWERHLESVPESIRATMVRYLECCVGTHARSTVSHTATRLAYFGRHLAAVDPALTSLAELDRQRHIEPYLTTVANTRHHRTGALLSASERRSRIFVVSNMLEAIAEWGWAEAPARRLFFSRDAPRLPRPLPRYLPPDADRKVLRALESSPHRLLADALLLLRATGLRIGELVDLELDCVHEVPGQGAWLKVPLGKLDSERMVPLDDQTVDIVDRIACHRSPGRPLRHPRTGRLVEFLLTHQGRRLSPDTLRDELARASRDAGLDTVTPHQLRHTYATALVNAGVSLQALMVLLGHQTAAMSLRYGRLFDATVRADYERALTLAKERMGPVLPATSTPAPKGNWRELPLIKARLAGGYCLRTAAQGACAYANICEHCPNFRSESAFLPILATQRADAEVLAADAEARGWGDEATRHRRLVERLDMLLSRAEGQ